MFDESFDVIVIGAGHAGCEAASASARLGAETALVTINLDLIGQMHGAALQGPLGAGLAPLLDEADALLRRGVVEASYRWAVSGPPSPDAQDAGEWDVPIVLDEEPEPRGPRGLRDRRPPTARAPRFAGQRTGPGARRAQAGRRGR